VIVRKIEQALGDAPDAVLRGERHPVAIRFRESSHEHPDEDQRGIGMVAEEVPELFAVKEARLDVVDRDRRSGPALRPERGHIADQLARPPDRQHNLALIAAVGH
jgi:hypothetical protein